MTYLTVQEKERNVVTISAGCGRHVTTLSVRLHLKCLLKRILRNSRHYIDFIISLP